MIVIAETLKVCTLLLGMYHIFKMCREIIIAFARALGGTKRCQLWIESEWGWDLFLLEFSFLRFFVGIFFFGGGILEASPFSVFSFNLFALFSFFFCQILVSLSSSLKCVANCLIKPHIFNRLLNEFFSSRLPLTSLSSEFKFKFSRLLADFFFRDTFVFTPSFNRAS